MSIWHQFPARLSARPPYCLVPCRDQLNLPCLLEPIKDALGRTLRSHARDFTCAAIHSAARGTLVLGHGAQAAVIAAAAAAPPPTALAALDSRDQEILQLLIQGLPTAQVAARLFLAPKTIRNRVSEMLDKLGVATRDEAIALGRASGLGTPHNRAV
jgi:DNA-binding NarL/FixJ family response regulator